MMREGPADRNAQADETEPRVPDILALSIASADPEQRRERRGGLRRPTLVIRNYPGEGEPSLGPDDPASGLASGCKTSSA